MISKAIVDYAYISALKLKQSKQKYFLISNQKSLNLLKASLDIGASYKLKLDNLLILLKASVEANTSKVTSDLALSSNRNAQNININSNTIGLGLNLASVIKLNNDLSVTINAQTNALSHLNKIYEIKAGVRWGF